MDPDTAQTAAKETSLWGYIVSALLGGGVAKVMDSVGKVRTTSAEVSGKHIQNDLTLAGGWQEMYREVKDELRKQKEDSDKAKAECKAQIELLSAHMDELRNALRSNGDGVYMA